MKEQKGENKTVIHRKGPERGVFFHALNILPNNSTGSSLTLPSLLLPMIKLLPTFFVGMSHKLFLNLTHPKGIVHIEKVSFSSALPKAPVCADLETPFPPPKG